MDNGYEGGRRREARTILAIDRSRATLHALAYRLGNLGYLTLLADRGAEALDFIDARGFDLMLLDMTMPDLSALRILRGLRAAGDTADLPVIMVTAPGDHAATVAALAAGADDCVAKPYDIDVLAARMARTLARATQIDDLKRCNLALDARVAARAIELGETRDQLSRLAASLSAADRSAVRAVRYD
jgi:DNA-binding response OmpR family regulator